MNLSEVVVRPWDTVESLQKKVGLAAILGTLQSGLTNFRYLRPIWQKNTEEECLLGVSLTGIMDSPLTRGDSGWGQLGALLEGLRHVAVDTNKALAPKLGLNVSAAVTCVKPSGTVSQLVSSASGIHPWYSPYFIRRVRQAKTDPISNAMIQAGAPHEEDIANPSQWVFSFPMRSPDGVPDRRSEGALRQLDRWLVYMRFWAEHQVSSTIYVQEHEWLHVAAWVYENFDKICGLSFLPAEDEGHVYEQAPYEEISKEKYDELVAAFPEIVDLHVVEEEDNTTGTQELACVAGVCEV
jgi:ribonucleoside-diphosphate reductase alpha chain